MKRLFTLAAVATMCCGSDGLSAPLQQFAVAGLVQPIRADNAQPPLHTINIIGDTDERGPITVKGPEAGLSAEEIQHIRATTGYVGCPGTKYHNGATGSGALIISSNQIITAAHVIVDDNGRYREPLDQCYFQTQTVPWTKVYLDFSGAFIIGTHHPNGPDDFRRDYAIVKLKRAIDAIPLPVSATPIEVDDRIFGVMSYQIDLISKFSSHTEPVSVICQAKRVFAEAADNPTGYDSTCDMAEGGSGGVSLVRIDGRLTIKGIFIRGGKPKNDYKPFNPDRHSGTWSVGVDGGLVAKALAMAHAKSAEPEPEVRAPEPKRDGGISTIVEHWRQ